MTSVPLDSALPLTFLGPEGTFTESALLQVPGAAGAQRIPSSNAAAALAKVRTGEAVAAMLPIENSIEGGVPATLDAISNGVELRILHEVVVPVSFVLVARAGVSLADIRAVGTHPHAWAQTREWFGKHLPLATHVPANSTTLAIPLPEDHPGALMAILEQFASRGVNLSRIESRPTGQFLGHYTFSVDVDGHIRDARVADALRGLHRVSPGIRFLGSYPRADQQPPSIRAYNSDTAFAEAGAWVEALAGQAAAG